MRVTLVIKKNPMFYRLIQLKIQNRNYFQFCCSRKSEGKSHVYISGPSVNHDILFQPSQFPLAYIRSINSEGNFAVKYITSCATCAIAKNQNKKRHIKSEKIKFQIVFEHRCGVKKVAQYNTKVR